MRFLFAIACFIGLTACKGSGSDLPIRAYHAEVQPLMVENEDLADKFIELAIKINQEDIPGEQVASILEAEIIPLAERLKARAAAIVLGDNELGQVHGILVQAWGLRATAYQQMVEAYENSDTSIFDNALENNGKAKNNEEVYFQEVNRYFSTENLRLIQFPKAG